MFEFLGKILGKKVADAAKDVDVERSLFDNGIIIEEGVETTMETLDEITNGKGDDE